MKKYFFVFLKYAIMLVLLLYVLFNPTARKLFSRYMQMYELKADIENAEAVNAEYKKRLYYLETKPEYMERIVKEELEVIAEDEIEYRFES